jgi:hypothetical protein
VRGEGNSFLFFIPDYNEKSSYVTGMVGIGPTLRLQLDITRRGRIEVVPRRDGRVVDGSGLENQYS